MGPHSSPPVIVSIAAVRAGDIHYTRLEPSAAAEAAERGDAPAAPPNVGAGRRSGRPPIGPTAKSCLARAVAGPRYV
eukprot:scaffold262378_cov28-Tisochrysis_lutea.AAC.2